MKRDHIDVIELLEAIKVPQIESSIYMKLESLKTGEHARFIAAYNEKKRKLKKSLFEVHGKEPENEQGSSGVNTAMVNTRYWFELLRYKAGSWRPTYLEPEPPPLTDVGEILPEEAVRCIEEAPISTDAVVSVDKIYSSLSDKTLQIKFVRYSQNSAMGVIRETVESFANRSRYWKVTDAENSENLERLIYYYMQRYPEVKKALAGELFHVLLPTIVGRPRDE